VRKAVQPSERLPTSVSLKTVGVGTHEKPAFFGRLDPGNGGVKYPVALHTSGHGSRACRQGGREKRSRGRLETRQFFLNEHAVGTQVDGVCGAGESHAPGCRSPDRSRFAAAQTTMGGAAFIHGRQTFGHAEFLFDGRFILADAAAARAREIAGRSGSSMRTRGTSAGR